MNLATRLFITVSVLISLTACAGFTERRHIRQGLLELDLSQQSFKDEWGKPTRVAALSGDEIISSRKGGEGRLFFRGSKLYEVWDYDSRQITLIFQDKKLVTWQTQKTVAELAEKPKKNAALSATPTPSNP